MDEDIEFWGYITVYIIGGIVGAIALGYFFKMVEWLYRKIAKKPKTEWDKFYENLTK